MNLTRNVVFNVCSWLVPLGATFIFTPIIVRDLGTASYGVYALVVGFLAYSFQFATSRAVPVYLHEYRATDRGDKVGDVISAALAVNLVLGVVALAFFLVATDWLVASVLNIAPEYQREARISFYLTGGTILFMLVSQVFSAVPQALHRFDYYASVTLLSTLSLQTGNVLLVVAGHDVISLFVWNLTLMCLNCVAFWCVAQRLLPEARLSPRVSRTLLWRMVRYSGGVIAYQALANMLFIFERIWLTRTSGHESITFYVIPMSIALCINAFIASLGVVVFPLASEAHAQQNKARLKVLYTRSVKFITVFVVFPVITLSMLSSRFLLVWMGTAFAENSAKPLVLLAIAFGLTALGSMSWALADGLGRPWFNALFVVGLIVVTVPVMLWLTPAMGVVGSGYGRLAGALVTVPLYTLLVERWMFGRCFWRSWGSMVLYLGVIGSTTGVAQYVMLEHLPVSWMTLGLVTVLSGLFYCGAVWCAPYFDKDEKAWLFRLMERKERALGT